MSSGKTNGTKDLAKEYAEKHAAAHPEKVEGCPMCKDPRPFYIDESGIHREDPPR